MCTTCGCNSDQSAKILIPGQYSKTIIVDDASPRQVHILERKVLQKNDHDALHNRMHFQEGNLLAINMMSSPGAGKTTLLERTILALKDKIEICVIEGDQQTQRDALRIQATGAPVIQINTGRACHLNASMVHKALHTLEPPRGAIIIIENVGNLVCPALFDLGEDFRIVLMSVTEGDDKPLKYPGIFESAQICVINKTDLLPYVDFQVEKAKEYALQVNHRLHFFELSATSGQGMENWLNWLKYKHAELKP